MRPPRPRLLAAEGVDALTCEQESAAIYAATEPLKSLVEGVRPALRARARGERGHDGRIYRRGLLGGGPYAVRRLYRRHGARRM